MTAPLHIDPGLHDSAVAECLDAYNRGNSVQALVLAMTAGINAGVLGLKLSDCPQAISERLDLYLEWIWGRDIAKSTNDNNKQLGFL